MSRSLPDDVGVVEYMETYMPRALNRHPDRLDGIDCVLQFDISGEGGGTWAVTVRDRAASVARGAGADPRCTIGATAKDWMDLVRGRLNGPMAFMTGRVKLSGDYFFAMKLGTMLVNAISDLKKQKQDER